MSSDGDSSRAPDVDAAGRRIPRVRTSRPQRRTLKRSEVLARHLVSHIVDADLPGGTVLPSEKEMVESFGVGRTTVREALRLLESRGVLTVRTGPGGGPVVRRPRHDDLGEPLCRMLQIAGSSLADVSAARTWVESAVARIAATRITPDQIVQLRAINATMSGPGLENPSLFSEENDAFHGLIARTAGNAVLGSLLGALASVYDGRTAGVTYEPDVRRRLARDHTLIVDALAAADPAAAVEAVQSHINNGLEHWHGEVGELVGRPIRWTSAPRKSPSAFALGDGRLVEKASELIARELTDQIIDGSIPEGTRLSPEREMAGEFEVGRATLREALRLLETRGLLYLQQGPRGGPIVRHPSPADLADALALVLHFERATVDDLFEARRALETDIARLGATRVSEDELTTLSAANAALLDVVDDDAGFASANREFHYMLARACGNGVLEMFAQALLSIGDAQALEIRYRLPERQRMHREHVEILHALTQAEPALAEQAMSAHLGGAYAFWTSHYPDTVARPVRWT